MGTTARAKVTLTVEIDILSTWGDDCSLSQVYDQASKQAANAVKNLFKSHVLIVGEPQVEAVVVRK